jgi:hypothetical protein
MAEIRDENKYAQLQELKKPEVPSFQLTPTVKQVMANRMMNTGNSVSGPNQVKPQDYTKLSGKEFLEREVSNLTANLASANNPFAYAKGVSFNAAHTGLNFDRYHNHPNFKKLGFSPFRDNESFYNNNSTWADDFARAKGQYLGLAYTGASSMLKNWGSLMSDAPDTGAAWDMEKAMAIGMSSKEGFGAGFTNFFLNSAYTVGIIGEIAMEEVALGLATVGTGGGAGMLAATRTAQNIGRFGKGLASLFKSADRVNDARKLLANAGKGALNFINPAENLTDFAKGIKAGEKGQMLLKNADGGFDAVTKSFLVKQGIGAGIKDLRAINAVSSEAKLEAGMVQNEVANKLIEEFYTEKGRMPEGKEAEFISSRAKEAGAKTFMGNLGGIYLSNKIVLDTALKGFKPLRNIIDDAGSDFLHAINKVKGGGKKVTLVDKNSLGKYFKKDYYKAVGQSMTPKKILGSSLRYTSANLAEGAQELYQESLSAGLIDHYTNQHMNGGRVAEANIWDALSFGSGKLGETGQGLEVFMSGFAMGGALGPIQNLTFNQGSKAFGYAKDYFRGTKTMEEAKKNRETVKTRLETSLSAIVNDPAKFANALSENVKMQDDFVNLGSDAEGRGDKKGANDAKDDSMFNHIHTLLQHGMYDVFTDQLKDLKNLKPEEMASAFGNNDESNIQADEFNKDIYGRIDSAVARAEGIKERYDTYNKKYRNPFNKNNPDEIFDWMGFEQTRKMAIFSDYTFDRAAKRMQGVFDYLSKVSPLKPAEAGRITSLLDDSLLDDEIRRLELEVKSYGESTDLDTKAKSAKRQSQLEAIKDFRAAMINYRASYDEAKQAALKPEVEEEMRKTRQMYTPGSVVEFEKGDQTFKAKVLRTTNKGNVIVEYTDAKGNKVKDAITKEQLALIGESAASDEDFSSPQTNFVSENRQLLYDAYQAYVKAIANETGDFVNSDNVQKSFAGILDHIELRDDASKMSEQVAKFLDPEFFAQSSQRMSDALKQAHANAKAKLSKQLDDFMNREVQNDFFNALEDIKVFFNPDDIDAFIKDGIVPNNFLDAESLTLITPSDPRYKQIIDLLEKYEEVTGTTLSGKPLSEVESLAGRLIPAKDADDNRTIADLAKDLGFDPKKGGTVKVVDLLNYIINSDKSTEVEKKLAQKLATAVDPNALALMDMTHGTNSSYDATNGLIIDPRFSTKDYAQGNIRFEYSALSGIARMVADSALQDAEFEAKINLLMEQVKTAINEGRVTNALAALGYDPQEVFGLANTSDFVAEALNNPAFQQVLENITVENTEKNLWEELLDTIKDVLKKMLGVRGDNNTALTQAMALISNKFDPTGTSFAKATATQASASKVSVGTPFDEMPEDLKVILTQVYDGEAADIDAWIQNSDDARALINAYNKGTQPAEEQQAPVATPGETGPQAISEKQKIQLRALGYNSTDITGMSYDEAVKIIGAGTKKGAQQGIPLMITQEMEKQLKDLGYSQEEIDKLKPEQARNIIDNKIAKATPQQQALTEEELMYDSFVNNRISIPWTSVVYDPSVEGNKRTTSGSNDIIDFTDRKVVVIPINGRNIPFYLSTGGGGKKCVPAGKWYPFFGLSEEGWFNKLGEKEINNYYGSEVLKGLSEALDRNIGDIRNDNTIPKVPSKGTHMDVINKDLNPTENEKADTRTIIESNIKDVVDFLKQSVSKPGQPTASTEEPVVLPIQNGTMQFSTSTETFAEYYSFEVKDGKIVLGKYRSSFQGEYRDSQEERPIPESELNSTYNKVKNYKDQKIKETTPAPKSQPGQQLDLFEEEVNSDNNPVVSNLRGKVIYVSPGMNIAQAAESSPFIINGDDIIAIEFAKSGISEFENITPENMTSKIANFWSNKNKKDGDVEAYQAAIARAYIAMKGQSDMGITVLSHSMALLNNPNTPLDLVITPSKSSVYANAQSDVLQIKQRRAAELGARATKTHRVTDATNILDVLTGKEKVKNSKITVTDQNLVDQIDAITSLPSLYAMRYETSFMNNAQLADLGVTIDELSDLLDEKQKSLETVPDFDNIEEGNILVANDGTLMYVSWHNKQTGEMGVKPIGTKGKAEILTFSNYAKSIKAIFAKGMTIPETKPEITPEEQKTAEENIKASIAELDPNALREMEKDIDTDEDSALDEIDPC